MRWSGMTRRNKLKQSSVPWFWWPGRLDPVQLWWRQKQTHGHSSSQSRFIWCISSAWKNDEYQQLPHCKIPLITVWTSLSAWLCWYRRFWSASDAAAVFLICWRSPFSLDLLKGPCSSVLKWERNVDVKCRKLPGNEGNFCSYIFLLFLWPSDRKLRPAAS